MKQVMLAIQFLTILPVRIKGDVSAGQVAASAAFFPLAGALQAFVMIIVAAGSMKIFPPELTAGLVIAVGVLINGGLHLDGLSDTFDGLAVKSSGSREEDIKKRFAVMKDSSAGAIGVISIVLLILLKYLLLSNLFSRTGLYTALTFILLMPVVSRWAMVVVMRHSKPVVETGLGHMFISNIDRRVLVTATLTTLGICVFAALPYLGGYYALWFLSILIAMISSVYAFSMMSVKFFAGRFNGLTGDHAGAVGEVSELIILLLVNIWSGLYTL
ncbi:MAG: adenosylcobinamide-GDP ribazoletransferase [Nitrospiraceae bacterium]|nr:adenosylcobinamide-GDP ribazoletransferase [Nitrospiraceae bacterium]